MQCDCLLTTAMVELCGVLCIGCFHLIGSSDGSQCFGLGSSGGSECFGLAHCIL